MKNSLEAQGNDAKKEYELSVDVAFYSLYPLFDCYRYIPPTAVLLLLLSLVLLSLVLLSLVLVLLLSLLFLLMLRLCT